MFFLVELYSFTSCSPNCKKCVSRKGENNATSEENSLLCLELVKGKTVQKKSSNGEGTKLKIQEILSRKSSDRDHVAI